jgi:hypothetical protein
MDKTNENPLERWTMLDVVGLYSKVQPQQMASKMSALAGETLLKQVVLLAKIFWVVSANDQGQLRLM